MENMASSELHMNPLEIWHAYRLPLILGIFIILTLIKSELTLRQRHKGPSASSLPGSPNTIDKNTLDWSSPKTDVGAKLRGLDDDHVENVTIIAPTKVLGKGIPKRITGNKSVRKAATRAASFDNGKDKVQPLVFYSSLLGTTKTTASEFVKALNSWRNSSDAETFNLLEAKLHDLSEIELDDYFISPPKGELDIKYFYLMIIPSYNIDTIMNTFLEHLQETHNDFRIDTAPLEALLGYSVFGLGDLEGWPTEEEGFCSQAKEVDKWLARLTGKKRAFPLGMGDVKSDATERLQEWRFGVQEVFLEILSGRGLGDGVVGSGDPVESDEEDAVEEEEEDGDEAVEGASRTREAARGKRVDDVEDLGLMIQKESPSSSLVPIDFTAYKSSNHSIRPNSVQIKEMVPKSSPTYAALTKQGYTIVGSHSGVKICRWTKSALRGRGSCYKFSFYGIKSHLCMETTPSLSCSNKCVFCWRHGTNPVGTTWRWVVDPPEEIFKGVKEGHYKKIKMMKGVPGVRAERFAEAMRIRHCALSLVGEPIFYPHINEFTTMLHKEHISSFLVCNAQHPDQLAALKPVTQLYVSIDASNRESLRKIDRPLHRDFWERFQRCLEILREKRFQQRTVFRLTLVKGFNVEDEVEGYADLVARSLPCFVEIKGVTYCGTSTSSSAGLTMQNVPFYAEVTEFVTALNDALAKRGLEYGIAAEHAHSCCVLLASTRFRRDGKWCTLIDYDKFFECLESGKSFMPEDYMGPPTPEWALWGNGGFNPEDERVDRKGRKKEIAEI
ncbi:hypothetical protein M501DRAFT_992752 [Patellaria atrata CBS 101060]|uniref:S-adenosyl-L-methionine-dependent tRNA 4-demethylwyosine synthase n=1 Tax=Patellaria atrata CBS 101060 TaxID=1346257 RepID=A0A9P4SA38_9PEZI|nr:hypothetical protein M501DRAFT_992752 [Patellaria atrata CBS 101060]